jgi:YidC/Oxa1 family membrane protein insertase
MPNQVYVMGAIGQKQTVAAGATQVFGSKLYVGPEVASRLDKLAPHLSMTIDYGWLWFIAIIIFWLMKHIYDIVGNWGFAIIGVTILIKLVFYKLSETSYKSMAKMRGLQPKLNALKEKYADDKQAMSKASMQLYKTEGVNPLGGCLPILIQIPVFIALYWCLIASVELRQAPFILWIHDLSAPDPYYILPIIMGVSMFLQQRLSPKPADPMQAKIMMFLPVFFTFLFARFPAGLVLYWTVNNIISILQQWWITKRYEAGAYDKKKKKRKKK